MQPQSRDRNGGRTGDRARLGPRVPVPGHDRLVDRSTDQVPASCGDARPPGSENATDRTIAAAYFSKRLLDDGWGVLGEEALDPMVAGHLLAGRDLPEAWKIAESRGEAVEHAYWSEFQPYGLGGNFPHVKFAAGKLLGVGRPAACLRLIGLYLRKDAGDDELVPVVADALEALLTSYAEDAGSSPLEGIDTYDFTQLFKFLEAHRDEVGVQRLGQLEWGYLGALGLDPYAPTLYRALADEPAFFVEVVSALYKPHSADPTEPTEAAQKIAENGYRLLSSWHVAPGEDEDGHVVEGELLGWIEKARELLRRWTGSRLAKARLVRSSHTPAPIPTEVGRPRRSGTRSRTSTAGPSSGGMSTARYNSRGVVSKSIDAGGEAEHELAEQFERFAEAFRDRWPRSTAVLRDLADSITATHGAVIRKPSSVARVSTAEQLRIAPIAVASVTDGSSTRPWCPARAGAEIPV